MYFFLPFLLRYNWYTILCKVKMNRIWLKFSKQKANKLYDSVFRERSCAVKGLIQTGVYEKKSQRKVLIVPTQALSGGGGVLAKMCWKITFFGRTIPMICKCTSSFLAESHFLKCTNALALWLQAYHATFWSYGFPSVACQWGEKGLVKLTENCSTPDGCISQDKFFSCHFLVRLSFPVAFLQGGNAEIHGFGHSDIDLYMSFWMRAFTWHRHLFSLYRQVQVLIMKGWAQYFVL